VGVSHWCGLCRGVDPLGLGIFILGERYAEYVGTDGGRRAVAGLYSGGLHITLSAAVRLRCLAMHATGGRQASLWRGEMLVERKQFVTHRQTLFQKAFMGSSSEDGGNHKVTPYSKIGAKRLLARRWHR
jgi:hypothetical protein